MLPNDQPVSNRRQSSGHCEATKEHESKRQASYQSEPSTSEGPPYKKNRRLESARSLNENEFGSDSQYGREIHWEEYFGDWPPIVAEQRMSVRKPPAAQSSSTPFGSISYSKQVRDGNCPPAWTRRHAEKMEEAGLFMEAKSTPPITEECQELCDKLLKADYAMPAAYRQDRLMKVFERVRLRNEARLVRDLMPIMVPSPELLHIDGHAKLDNLCEALNAEWTQCDTLCGPRPKPDFVGGISAAAFTKDEKEKLQMMHTSACPNLFPESMYFPFLICEVKGSDQPLGEAERQAMHSASIATRAVIELFRKVSATAEVQQKILAFSVAHNDSTVIIHAHFATIQDQQTNFFRQLILHHGFAGNREYTVWTKPYKIIRAVYEHFVPQHLARIRGALSRMRSPALASIATQVGTDQESPASTPEQSSLQEDGIFKKPALPAAANLQAEYDKLRDGYSELLRQVDRQNEESRKQKATMEKQQAQLEQLATLLKMP